MRRRPSPARRRAAPRWASRPRRPSAPPRRPQPGFGHERQPGGRRRPAGERRHGHRQALQDLIASGNPLFKNGELWIPHGRNAPRSPKAVHAFRIALRLRAEGRPPHAIADLSCPASATATRRRCSSRHRLGQDLHRRQRHRAHPDPALILAPKQDAAAQLYGEFKNFFPDNAVEWSISFPTTTTTSRKPTSRAPTRSSRRNPRSTSRSTGCATPPPARAA